MTMLICPGWPAAGGGYQPCMHFIVSVGIVVSEKIGLLSHQPCWLHGRCSILSLCRPGLVAWLAARDQGHRW